MFPHFVSAEIITWEDFNDFQGALPTSRLKAKWFMSIISRHLEAGHFQVFHKMLLILEEHGCKKLSNDIQRKLTDLKKVSLTGIYCCATRSMKRVF